MKHRKFSSPPLLLSLFAMAVSSGSMAIDKNIIEINSSISFLYQYQTGIRFMQSTHPYYFSIASDFLKIGRDVYYAGQQIGAGRRTKTMFAEFGMNIKAEIPVYTDEIAIGLDLITTKRIYGTPLYVFNKLETSYFLSQENVIGSGKSKQYFYNVQLGLAYRF